MKTNQLTLERTKQVQFPTVLLSSLNIERILLIVGLSLFFILLILLPWYVSLIAPIGLGIVSLYQIYKEAAGLSSFTSQSEEPFSNYTLSDELSQI